MSNMIDDDAAETQGSYLPVALFFVSVVALAKAIMEWTQGPRVLVKGLGPAATVAILAGMTALGAVWFLRGRVRWPFRKILALAVFALPLAGFLGTLQGPGAFPASGGVAGSRLAVAFLQLPTVAAMGLSGLLVLICSLMAWKLGFQAPPPPETAAGAIARVMARRGAATGGGFETVGSVGAVLDATDEDLEDEDDDGEDRWPDEEEDDPEAELDELSELEEGLEDEVDEEEEEAAPLPPHLDSKRVLAGGLREESVKEIPSALVALRDSEPRPWPGREAEFETVSARESEEGWLAARIRERQADSQLPAAAFAEVGMESSAVVDDDAFGAGIIEELAVTSERELLSIEAAAEGPVSRLTDTTEAAIVEEMEEDVSVLEQVEAEEEEVLWAELQSLQAAVPAPHATSPTGDAAAEAEAIVGFLEDDELEDEEADDEEAEEPAEALVAATGTAWDANEEDDEESDPEEAEDDEGDDAAFAATPGNELRPAAVHPPAESAEESWDDSEWAEEEEEESPLEVAEAAEWEPEPPSAPVQEREAAAEAGGSPRGRGAKKGAASASIGESVESSAPAQKAGSRVSKSEDWAQWDDEPVSTRRPTAPSEDAGAAGQPTLFAHRSEVGEDIYQRAVALVIDEERCSTTMLQRGLAISFSEASAIVERMYDEGLVGPQLSSGRREVLIDNNSRTDGAEA